MMNLEDISKRRKFIIINSSIGMIALLIVYCIDMPKIVKVTAMLLVIIVNAFMGVKYGMTSNKK